MKWSSCRPGGGLRLRLLHVGPALQMLHFVQPLIGNADQNVFLITVCGKDRNSIVQGESNTGLHRLHGGPEIRADAACQGVGLFSIGMYEQEREFVAANAE